MEKRNSLPEQESLQWLSSILDILREECSWDRAQTMDTLRYLTIEEVYELSDAILDHKDDDIRKELGDIFMHILFYSKIAEEEKTFTLTEVIDGVCSKLISRHPHISLPNKKGEMIPASCQEAPKWEKVKMKEGRTSVLEGVPRSLPSMVKAIRILEKVEGVGFRWNTCEDAHSKVKEEEKEVLDVILGQDASNPTNNATLMQERLEEEMGDFLFASIAWCRSMGIDADKALCNANIKFQKRFQGVEQIAIDQRKSISDLSAQEMIQAWKDVKKKEP